MRIRRLRNSFLPALAVLGLIVVLPAQAQILSAPQLLARGDQTYRANCVRGAKHYFALTQKFPDWLTPVARQRLLSLIAQCEAHPLGQPGTDAKFDDGRRPGCIAYAEIAVTEARAAASVGACKAATGPRWSQSIEDHYAWCMADDVPRENVRAEREARRRFLDHCAYQ